MAPGVALVMATADRVVTVGREDPAVLVTVTVTVDQMVRAMVTAVRKEPAVLVTVTVDQVVTVVRATVMATAVREDMADPVVTPALAGTVLRPVMVHHRRVREHNPKSRL
jgi:Na+-transporting NADH:ubiquinone oxidoreductase subunit NqrD